jgi:hypothetical protein
MANKSYKSNIIIIFSIIIFIIIPSFIISDLNLINIFFLLIYNTTTFLLILTLFFLNINKLKSNLIKYMLFGLGTVYYWILYFLITYKFYEGSDFDPFLFLDGEVIKTGLKIFGLGIFLLMLLYFIFLLVLFFILLILNYNNLKRIKNNSRSRNTVIILIIFLFILFLIPLKYQILGSVIENMIIIKNLRFGIINTNSVRDFPDNSIYDTNSSQNIFILQLESGNALTLDGQVPKYSDIYLPNIYNITQKNGIFFPFFIGNSVMTNRAQENILCGIFNNYGEEYDKRLDQLKVKCLPEILKQSGYKTIIFYGLNDINYSNSGNFFKKIGFDEIHYSDIMKKDDKSFYWGYDDCIFYKRAFEFLKDNYANYSKLFVYFAVSSSHVAFEQKNGYEFLNKFNPPKNSAELYLNSFLYQDYCVSQFYEEYKSLYANNSNLFILPDHSVYALGNNKYSIGSFFANHLIFLSYFPPINKIKEFKIGEEIKNLSNLHSQTDIIPTIFEILNNKGYQNSFAYDLIKNRTEENYEDCQIYIHLYWTNSIVIAHEKDRYIYLFNNKVMYYNVEFDPFGKNLIVLSKNMTLNEFQDRYYCNRFKGH